MAALTPKSVTELLVDVDWIENKGSVFMEVQMLRHSIANIMSMASVNIVTSYQEVYEKALEKDIGRLIELHEEYR